MQSMFSEEIFDEIDNTLDKLIENASAMKDITLSKHEIEAFQNTQTSLLNHLMHMDCLLEEKRKKIKITNHEKRGKNINEKLGQFEKLNCNFIKNASEKIRLLKRCKRKKSFKTSN